MDDKTMLETPVGALWKYGGRCNQCGHFTEASRQGETCCKWGGCNGTVSAKLLNPSAAEIGKGMGDGE